MVTANGRHHISVRYHVLFVCLFPQHDPDTNECSPGGDVGNYIMYSKATSGNDPNNNKFSTCSLDSMAEVLEYKARGKGGCFRGRPQEHVRRFYYD